MHTLAALRAAFGSGYPTDVDVNTGEIRQQDGFVSSLVTLTFILPLGFSICVCHWITLNNQTKDVDRASVHFFKITYMLFSIVIMLILRFSTCANHLYAKGKIGGNPISQPEETQQMELKSSREPRNVWRVIRGALPLIGLVLFYGIGIFLDLFRIVANFSCWETFRQCHLLRHCTASIAYHSIKILFMGVLMLFVIFFKEKVMLQCCKTRFSLVFIVAAAATVWFDITLDEEHGKREDIMNNTCHLPNASQPVLLGQIQMRCVNESTDLYQTVQDMSPYFYPVNIEFLLLCIEILIKLFFTMKPQAVVDMLKQEGESSSINSGQRALEPEAELSQNNASTPLLGVGQGARQESTAGGAANYGAIGGENLRNVPGAHSSDNVLPRREPSPNVTGETFDIWCLMAIISNGLFIVFGILTYLKQEPDIWNDRYQIAKVIYWIPLLGALAVAYIAMQGMASDFYEFSGLELTVVFSNTGFALSVFFQLISAVSVIGGSMPVDRIFNNHTIIPLCMYEPKRHILRLIISDKLLNIIQVFFQSNLLLQAARVKRRLDNDESSTRNTCFSVAMMYLAICNLTLWGIDSFVEMKNMCLGPTQEYYLGQHTWHLIIHLTIPFILFYRFNCGIIFLEILLGFRHP